MTWNPLLKRSFPIQMLPACFSPVSKVDLSLELVIFAFPSFECASRVVTVLRPSRTRHPIALGFVWKCSWKSSLQEKSTEVRCGRSNFRAMSRRRGLILVVLGLFRSFSISSSETLAPTWTTKFRRCSPTGLLHGHKFQNALAKPGAEKKSKRKLSLKFSFSIITRKLERIEVYKNRIRTQQPRFTPNQV